MTIRKRQQSKRSYERRISVRTVRRDPPDLRKLSRALLALAQADAEAQAQAQVERATGKSGMEDIDETS
ncbi:hypothetical protein GCM10022239_08560 [Leifsonia bigeumensis]|uniref:Uncharacterized protein n=1 Tax=Leifsonella bigeumensis TaxID=433643 RepID=A0ABP7FC38_9MICO